MFGRKEYIIIAVIWLLIGLLSVISICVYDMRGEPYDENYFKGEILHTIVLILTGGVSFLIVFYLIIVDILQNIYEKRKSNRIFTKFIYKIANIGIKKDGDKK
ncbi:hypothetical protein [Blautia massiliensis (ex Durand et al. 2017)]|uniref:hypothetical protein n=1 Tax=Blautia massiliensis (ex Durand et al. 2017) TaxID=1737424 RepID=UPI0011C85217|nr:hypothetical protein [Blautia massiliensis (ex Durand et al. 2017)]